MNEAAEESRSEPDPVAELADYIGNRWFRQLVPVQTCCFRCKADSPIVFAPYGQLLFGATRFVRKDPDITKEVIELFAQQGWRFQNKRSYCPTCKGLGAVT